MKALKKIANPKLTEYHKMVEEQVRLAVEALAEIAPKNIIEEKKPRLSLKDRILQAQAEMQNEDK